MKLDATDMTETVKQIAADACERVVEAMGAFQAELGATSAEEATLIGVGVMLGARAAATFFRALDIPGQRAMVGVDVKTIVELEEHIAVDVALAFAYAQALQMAQPGLAEPAATIARAVCNQAVSSIEEYHDRRYGKESHPAPNLVPGKYQA